MKYPHNASESLNAKRENVKLPTKQDYISLEKIIETKLLNQGKLMLKFNQLKQNHNNALINYFFNHKIIIRDKFLM